MSSSVARYFPRPLKDVADSHGVNAKEVAEEISGTNRNKQQNEVSDEELISQICLGSKDALALLFRRYSGLVHGISNKILRNQAEADDFVQDIFLDIRKEGANFDAAKGTAHTWILQMAYRRAISRRRYLMVRHFYTQLNLDEVVVGLSDERPMLSGVTNAIDEEFGRGALQKLFDELSSSQRETLCLFFMEGYTLEEIALKLGQSRGNIKHHYFRGLEKLRRHLFSNKLPAERTI